VSWYQIDNVADVPTPALAFYPARIEENIRRMIRIAGDPARLRPHVKTHKTPEVVALQLKHGIRRFKCSTIAEAEMTARAGAPDVLLAMQPVGPAVPRFLALMRAVPETVFGAIVDSGDALDVLAGAATAAGVEVRLWLDVNSGMNRTGLVPGDRALGLYRAICARPGVMPGGFHVYDGHIHEHDLGARTRQCDREFVAVQAMLDTLRAEGLPVPAVVAGGTPTFPIHVKREGVELSPGTPLLWDHGYSSTYSDLDFLHAAVLVGRVVSKPAGTRVTVDLGTKALASEMPQPRLALLGLDGYAIVAHNEEHLVIETPDADRIRTGDVVYGVPVHICPTVARYESVSVVRDGRCAGEWKVTARNRRITL
jgi:D-serine deaminase-like pyridoxal phosphate-dependent protein